jgi:type IV pilus assembly protein PilW
MTMIELLVAMAIGVTVTLAVSTLLVSSENQKRITTSTNDADQTIVYTFSEIDKALRAAGSGFVQSNYQGSQGMLGCRLNMASHGVTYMPRPGAYPAPFATKFLGGAAPAALQLAPVLIGAGQSDNNSSDVLVVMAGSGSGGGVTRPIYGAGDAITLILENTVGFSASDVVLLSQPGVQDCLIEQVNAVNPTTLTMNVDISYYTPGTTTTLTTLASSTSSVVTPLGNEALGSAPNNVLFEMFGVGTDNSLYSYDLMQNASLVQPSSTGDVALPIADQVIEMNALYGVNALYGNVATNPAQFSSWVNPADAAHHYDIVSVMNNPTTQVSIVAVRVAILVRGEYYDKKVVSPTSLTLFSGLVDGYGNHLDKLVQNLDPHYRYRVYEFTVPLRDLIVLAGGP